VVGTPQKLRWTYSDAKALEEATAHTLFITKNLRVTTVRLFNTVGPRQTGKYGMVLPRFVKAAVENKPLNIFGDGTQARVFCHVYDAVKAMLLLASENKSIGEVFNVGGVGEISILELANKIIKKFNSNSKIIFKNYADVYQTGYEDMQRRVPDISKIKTLIGWQPQLDLENIISDVSQDYI